MKVTVTINRKVRLYKEDSSLHSQSAIGRFVKLMKDGKPMILINGEGEGKQRDSRATEKIRKQF